MKVAIGRMTIEELDHLPDQDGNRYELIDGELYVTAAPRKKHQEVSMRLAITLELFVRKHGLGAVYYAPFDVYLEPPSPTRVEPDLLFVAKSREHIVQDKGVMGPPDLVVEIASESSYWADAHAKRDLYRRSGVAEYWFVDPDDRTILVYRFRESAEPQKLKAGDTLTSPLFPGLEIELDSIFAE